MSSQNQQWNVIINQAEKTYSIVPEKTETTNGQIICKTASLVDCISYVKNTPLVDKKYYQTLQETGKKNFFTFFVSFIMILMNSIFYLYLKRKNRPQFIDLKTNYPELLPLEKHIQDIQNELNILLSEKRQIPTFHNADPNQINLSYSPTNKKWSVFYLQCYGQNPIENRKLCPKTSALVDSTPIILEAFFSILDPGKSIPPHNGPYLGILRYHLALKVSKSSPPKIRIYDQFYTWTEGESVLFDDTWNHEVINDSSESRVVLFIDIKRKLPFFLDLFNNLGLRLIGTKYGKCVKANLGWNV